MENEHVIIVRFYKSSDGSRGGAAGARPPFRVPKTKKPVIFRPKYGLDASFEALGFNIFRGSMSSDPSRK